VDYDVVIGSRADRKNFPLYRRMGSRLFRLVRQALLLRQIKDTQCGFKLIRTKLAHRLFPRLEFFHKNQTVQGWTVTSFDVELLHLVKRDGKGIKEVLVAWEDRDLAKGKQKSYLKESGEMLKQIFRIKWNDILGKYRG
jgi:dolichyl-phosphate beta-glucosyltransferase